MTKTIFSFIVLVGVLAALGSAVYKQSKRVGYGGNTVVPYTLVNQPTSSSATTTQFTGNLRPDVNNVYDLGRYDNAWRNIYTSGTTYGILTFNDLVTLTGGLISNSSSSVGAQFQVAGNLNASSTFFAVGPVNVGTVSTTPTGHSLDAQTSGTTTLRLISSSATAGGCLTFSDGVGSYVRAYIRGTAWIIESGQCR